MVSEAKFTNNQIDKHLQPFQCYKSVLAAGEGGGIWLKSDWTKMTNSENIQFISKKNLLLPFTLIWMEDDFN